ncbi:MAG: TIGR03768 family metallophosphoesterase [Methanoregula sp.]|nr:TIGR03768 family metallophosphoesterase [Methanoregula sp.]
MESNKNRVFSPVAAPVVGFTGTPTFGNAPLTVAFTDTSTNTSAGWAWYFGDETYTQTWTRLSANAGWSFRIGQSGVVMPDGRIVLMGGFNNVTGLTNDVWQSTDNGATWTQVNASAGWAPRYDHSGLALADGSIVVMGGFIGTSQGTSLLPSISSVSRGFADGSSISNDVWRSTDNGVTWMKMTSNAGWSARSYQTSVVMPDGSIVLMGGAASAGLNNDVWRSTDEGATWTLVTASSGWSARSCPSSVVMSDGSIMLAGGEDSTGVKNDVWRSTDKGATWTQVNASAGWAPRYGHSSVAMPDGSIVLMGGFDGLVTDMNDVWRSNDKGATWTQVNASAGWVPRYGHSSVAMPDGSIVLAGGGDGSLNNDVWRIVPVGSSAQDPSHTYSSPGTYSVALQVYNLNGYNSTRKSGYINASVSSLAPVANFAGTPTSGYSPLTVQFTDSSTGIPTSWNWSFGDGGYSSAQNPVYTYASTGSFTVSLTATNSAGATTKTVANYITGTNYIVPSSTTVGIYRNGVYYLRNSNTAGNADLTIAYGTSGDIPVTGDWTGTGSTTIGVFRNGMFYLRNTNTAGNADNIFTFGQTGDVPLAGHWSIRGADTVGIFRNGTFFLSSSNTPGGGIVNAFNFGQAGDIPLAGDWSGSGVTTVGIFRNGNFFLASNNTPGGGAVNTFNFGQAGDIPLAGDWNGDGKTEVGIFRNGMVFLASGNTPGGGTVTAFTYGMAGDKPVAGRWIMAGYPIDSTVFTTVDHTIAIIPVPASSPVIYPYQVSNYTEYGYGKWKFGPGLPYQRREDILRPGYNNTSVVGTARLLNYFTITDIHITDEESPVSAIFLGYKNPTQPSASSAYSPVMMLTTQNFDAVVQTINAFHLKKPFDFGISLGDTDNSDQYNELRWYIDVLDGKVINPDSGVKDDPVPGPYNDYQDPFKAAGLNSTIPWFQTLGNHDHFYTGFLAPNDYFRNALIGTNIINLGYVFTNSLGMDSRGYYMGSIDGRTQYGDIIGVGPVGSFTSPPQVLAADPNRRSITESQWMAEFFNTTSKPVGHGFDQSNVDAGFACYSFDPKADIPIRVIVLDDTQADTDPINPESLGMGHATLDMARYNWLVSELERGKAENKLMIISAHIPIGVSAPGSDAGWNPVAPITEQQLIAKLHTYPNLLLWISGHRHVNQITPFNSTDPVNYPEQGFWEVETSSLRDLPQEFRMFEIVRNSDNTVSIITTDVDPAVRAGTPAAQSRSYGVAAQQLFSDPLSPPEGSANAILVKQLSPEMQGIIQNTTGTSIGL